MHSWLFDTSQDCDIMSFLYIVDSYSAIEAVAAWVEKINWEEGERPSSSDFVGESQQWNIPPPVEPVKTISGDLGGIFTPNFSDILLCANRFCLSACHNFSYHVSDDRRHLGVSLQKGVHPRTGGP